MTEERTRGVSKHTLSAGACCCGGPIQNQEGTSAWGWKEQSAALVAS